MYVFGSSAGIVSATLTGGAIPFSIGISGNVNAPEFPSYTLSKAILTGLQYGGRAGLGVSHTLRDRVYLYVFGDRVGKIEMSGYAFAEICNGASDANYTGFDAVNAYYEKARVTAQGLPVTLVIGRSTTFVGFMTDFVFGIEDASTGLGSFKFGFTSLPRNAFGQVPRLPWE